MLATQLRIVIRVRCEELGRLTGRRTSPKEQALASQSGIREVVTALSIKICRFVKSNLFKNLNLLSLVYGSIFLWTQPQAKFISSSETCTFRGGRAEQKTMPQKMCFFVPYNLFSFCAQVLSLVFHQR